MAYMQIPQRSFIIIIVHYKFVTFLARKLIEHFQSYKLTNKKCEVHLNVICLLDKTTNV